jgi:hypothetical protein
MATKKPFECCLKHGADVNAREEKYSSPPAGWANYAGHRYLRDLILRGPIDMFQAIEFDVTTLRLHATGVGGDQEQPRGGKVSH